MQKPPQAGLWLGSVDMHILADAMTICSFYCALCTFIYFCNIYVST